MKRFFSLLLAAVLTVSTLILPACAAESSFFQDVPQSHWAYDSVKYVYENKLMNGTSPTTFSPDKTFSRAMFVTILGRLDQVDTNKYPKTQFQDVPAGTWFTPYVAWAAEQNIINGYSSTKFGPNDTITKEQYCAIICRYLDSRDLSLEKGAAISFGDRDQISHYALDSVQAMAANELISLNGQNTVQPKAKLTRAEIADLFSRVHYGIGHGFHVTEPDPGETPDEEPAARLCLVDYIGKTVDEVTAVWGSDYVYEDGFWEGDTKNLYYEDWRIPAIFYSTDPYDQNILSGSDPIDLIEYVPNDGSLVTKDIPGKSTYSQLKKAGVSGTLTIGEDANSGWGETADVFFKYSDNISIRFCWYENADPYTTPPGRIFIFGYPLDMEY